MIIVRPLVGDTRITVIVRDQTKQRLATRCFRGSDRRVAGNFRVWMSVADVLGDREVETMLLEDLRDSWRRSDLGTNSVQIKTNRIVGWDSTAPADEYSDYDLEPFQPNRMCMGLRVKTHRKDLRAPATTLVTIVYELRHEHSGPVAVIHSMYPGRDIGDLRGDVTKREQRIFFDWGHPGQEL